MLTVLDQHRQKWDSCVKCEIGQHALNHVFCRGSVPCDILFVGEGPGDDEDKQGLPFVGRSGVVLDSWIMQAFNGWTGRRCINCNGTGTQNNYKPTGPVGGSNELENWPGACEVCVGAGEEFGRIATFAITNIVCCRPTESTSPRKGNRPPTDTEAINCSDRFAEFYRLAKPKGVVFLGKVAQQFGTLPILFDKSKPPILNLYHPSYILRNGGAESKLDILEVQKLKTFVASIRARKLLKSF